MPIHTDHIIANSDLFKLRSQKNTNHEVHVSIGDLSDSGLIIKTLNDVLTDGPSTGGLDIVMTTTDAITSSNSTHKIFLNNAYGELSLSTDGITQGEAFISLTATTADVNTALGFMNLNPTSAGIGNSNTGQIQFNSTYNFFRDHLASPAGLQYYADYSANYTTRSLVDKAYVDALVTAQDLDFQADSGGVLSIDLDSETLTLTGGTGIDTTGLANDVSFAIDSTVVTLTGSQILTNKTLTSPVLNGTLSGTAFLDEDTMSSDSAIAVASQQSIKAYVLANAGIYGGSGTVPTSVAVTITDTLNFDSDTFVVDGTNSRVGIGTTSPSEKFHVSGSGGTAIKVNDSSAEADLTIDAFTGFDARIFLRENGSSKWMLRNDASAGDDFHIYNYTAAAYSITVDGPNNYVGIGTNSPSVPLDVFGEGRYQSMGLGGSLYLKSSNGTNSVDHSGIKFISDVDARCAEIISVRGTSSQANSLAFRTYNSAVVDSMFLQYDGNVGIGTNAPSNTLHVDDSAADCSVRISSGTGEAQLFFNPVAGQDSYIQHKEGGVSKFLQRYDASANKYHWYNYTTASYSISIDEATNNVGIGTNSPAEALHVAGSGGTYMEVSDSTAQAGLNINGDTGFDSLLVFQESGSNRWALYNDASTGDDFRIYNYTAADTSILIDGTTNNVGIGTGSPSYGLDVNGDVRLGGAAADSVVIGHTAELATTATDGFLYLPCCDGTPTGVPTDVTGKMAFVVDVSSADAPVIYGYTENGSAWTAL